MVLRDKPMRLDIRPLCRHSDQCIGCHRMAQQSNRCRFGRDGVNHCRRLVHQKTGRTINRCDIARHRQRIAPVAQEFKHKDAVSRLRQRRGIVLHHLLGPSKSMRHFNHWAGRIWPRIFRDRGLTNLRLRDPDAMARDFKHPQREQNKKKAQFALAMHMV